MWTSDFRIRRTIWISTGLLTTRSVSFGESFAR